MPKSETIKYLNKIDNKRKNFCSHAINMSIILGITFYAGDDDKIFDFN